MDEMNIKLTTSFMRTMVSKFIARHIRKRYGYRVDIHLSELDVSFIDGETNIKVNGELKLRRSEFMKIINQINSED